MKELMKKVKNLIEKIFGIKFTRSIVVDMSKDLYTKNQELESLVMELNNTLRKLQKECKTVTDKTNKLQKECNVSSNTNDFYKTEFVIANDIWRRNGATTALLSRLEYLSESTIAWKNCQHEIWLIYISILLELGETENAYKVWNQYLCMHEEKIDWLHRYLLVSNFAERNGIQAENVLKASKIYNVLTESRKQKKFESLLQKANSIAIVGNGPSEKGLGKGDEIDNHDIVIRFNNFQTYGFEGDYGRKTDVWVKCSNDVGG